MSTVQKPVCLVACGLLWPSALYSLEERGRASLSTQLGSAGAVLGLLVVDLCLLSVSAKS